MTDPKPYSAEEIEMLRRFPDGVFDEPGAVVVYSDNRRWLETIASRRAEVERLIEALFIFADEGEEIRVGDYTIIRYSGDVADDDGWMVIADGSAYGVVHADFDDAVRAALARDGGEGEA